MRCVRCQTENREGRRFCAQCGAPLSLACPSCGFANEAGEKFCGGCGKALDISLPTPESKFSSPQAYTPRHLAEKILTSKSALEGERKQVTVLFADLKSSMELLADRDPEEARKLLDPVLERMMEAVHRYEGTVNQVMGDGIMALFGAPVAHEDHAVRACYAALDMQTGIRRNSDEVRHSHGVNVQIRVGLNSGEVVVRAIGSDLHMDYTAVGQTTHLAARMEQFATPGTILLTADTLRLAEGWIEVKPLGPVPVKGLEERVEVYEMVGAGPRRSRLHAAAARGLTRFVGREAELEQLRQALSRAAAGHGQVVAIVGEPGVGKSRLVWEVSHSHRTHGWYILQAKSVSYGKATPYLSVVDLLKGYFQIEDRDDVRRIREKVTGKLLTLDEALRPIMPALLALLDVAVEDAAWQALDPPQRRQRTLEAIRGLLLRESQAQPLLVVFEDLHWIDSETQALLDSLVESLPTARMLLLVNYRPEYEHRWGSKTYYAQLRIDPLPAESSEELLQYLLGSDASLQALKLLLIERTEGNPFFLEESVQTLVQTGVLAGERGAYRLARPFQAIQVPATVQAVLAARIDRLTPEDKRLLQTASVIGKDVSFALLQAIADGPEDSVRRGLSHLQAAEFLYETSLFPDLEYTFKHALTHEVAYGSVLQDRRRSLHARIVDAIEALYPERLTTQVERLAHHAFRGEVWEKAVGYLRQAGLRAMARPAYREAVACFEQALIALRHLPESRDTLENAIDVRLALRRALVPLGDMGRVVGCLREAEALAKLLEDRRRLGRVASDLTNYFWFIGTPDQAVDPGQQALAIAAELEDVSLQFVATLYLAQVHHALGDYPRGIDLLRENVEFLDRRPARGGFRVYSRVWLTWCLADVGAFAEAGSRADEAIRIAEAVDHPYSLTASYFGAGTLHLIKGDFSKSVTLLERVFDLYRRWDFLDWHSYIAASLGYAYALSGRLAEAVPLLEEGVTQTDAANQAYQPAWLGFLGHAYLLVGRSADAMRVAERALDWSRERKQRGLVAYSLRLLGEIAAQRDAPELEEAAASYQQALTLAGELGMRPLQAHCHFGLGKLYRRTGDRAKAQEHLASAATMYREMDMQFWLEKAGAKGEPGDPG
jgi:class 3 adenylate cyclase/tetratricopeptide (TPR) repeat protein